MMVDITNAVLTAIKTAVGSTVIVKTPSNMTESQFPCVTVEEIINDTDTEFVDTGGEKISGISLEINVYTIGEEKMTDAKVIRGQIDTVCSGTYRFTRNMARPVPNYNDESIYRIVLRYSFKIDNNKKIYRG